MIIIFGQSKGAYQTNPKKPIRNGFLFSWKFEQANWSRCADCVHRCLQLSATQAKFDWTYSIFIVFYREGKPLARYWKKDLISWRNFLENSWDLWSSISTNRVMLKRLRPSTERDDSVLYTISPDIAPTDSSGKDLERCVTSGYQSPVARGSGWCSVARTY